MAGLGVLLVAALSLAAALGFGRVSVEALRRARVADEARRFARTSEAWIFLLVAGSLAAAGLRQVTLLVMDVVPAAAPLELALFQALHVPAALSMIALMHLTARRLSGSPVVAGLAAAVFLGVAIVGIGYLYTGGFAATSEWSSTWVQGNEAAKSMILAFFALPSLTAAGLLIFAAHGIGGAEAKRIRIASLAATTFYVAFTMESVGATGLGLALGRALTLLAALLALFTYAPRDPFEALAARLGLQHAAGLPERATVAEAEQV